MFSYSLGKRYLITFYDVNHFPLHQITKHLFHAESYKVNILVILSTPLQNTVDIIVFLKTVFPFRFHQYFFAGIDFCKFITKTLFWTRFLLLNSLRRKVNKKLRKMFVMIIVRINFFNLKITNITLISQTNFSDVL